MLSGITLKTNEPHEIENEEGETLDDFPIPENQTSTTKKKKKPKKKKNLYNIISTLPEEEFNQYCEKILLETQNDQDFPEDPLQIPEMFEYYKFSGNIRPAYVSKQVTCPVSIQAPDYAETGQPISEQLADRTREIHVHTPEEIAKIRNASSIGREILDIAGRFCKAGVTGDEIDRIVHRACIERNAYPSSLNYYNFPKSCCISVNEVICHGIPDARPLEDGDIVNIDISVYVDGVHCDLNEMFMIGKVDEEGRNLVKSAYLALQAACAMIKPGTFYRDVGTEISKVATKGGCAVVKRYSGHGVGILFHPAPTIPHYAHNKAVGIMRPGHIFTIEPMLNVGNNWGDLLWPDNWTAVTKDGKRSAQFEHTFLVTETGVEILTARPGTSRTEMVWNEELEARLTRPGT